MMIAGAGSIYDWPRMADAMDDDMQTLINEQAEVTDYVHAHLEPLLRTYVRNCKNPVADALSESFYARKTDQKCWRLCDMWVTAFLINCRAKYLWLDLEGGHELYMKALRQWHASLLRNEALDDFHEQFKLQHDVPPRVEDAEDILATLVAGQEGSVGVRQVEAYAVRQLGGGDGLALDRDETLQDIHALLPVADVHCAMWLQRVIPAPAGFSQQRDVSLV
jgi:hypothetical protein